MVCKVSVYKSFPYKKFGRINNKFMEVILSTQIHTDNSDLSDIAKVHSLGSKRIFSLYQIKLIKNPSILTRIYEQPIHESDNSCYNQSSPVTGPIDFKNFSIITWKSESKYVFVIILEIIVCMNTHKVYRAESA